MAPKLEGPAIGIDLGTTYSCVGVWRHKSVEILVNNQGKRTTPSCVAFTNSDCLVGDAAELERYVNPTNTIFGMKHLIGKEFEDARVQNYISSYPFKVIKGPNKQPNVIVNYRGEQKQFSIEEISSMILDHMHEIAEAHTRRKVKNAVVTVPAYFNSLQRRATRNAGSIAGLNILQILNEPMAATIAYGLQNSMDMEKKNVLVFDLKDEMFDVSIVNVKEGQLKVKATAGDTSIGGKVFNNAVFDYLVEKFIYQHEEDIRESPYAIRRLRSACERAKVALSYATETRIDLNFLHEGIHLQSTITRTMFEELNMDLFRKCIDIVAMCLWDINMKTEDISYVVLVGGSTRIPIVERLLREHLPMANILKSINADEVVAHGATILAAKLVGERSRDIDNLAIHDAIPFSLGIEKLGAMNVLIPRNTLIPTSKEWACSTVKDNQSSINIRVYEGEREMVEDNNLLGEIDFEGIPPMLAGTLKITVNLKVDVDGVLTVMAKLGAHGPQKEMTFNNGNCWIGVDFNDQDVTTEEKNVTWSRRKLECFLDNLKTRIYDQEMAGKLKPTDKKKIEDKIVTVSDWLNSEESTDASKFDRERLELEKLWNDVSKRKPWWYKLC